MSEKSIENITTSEKSSGPTLINSYPLLDVKFNSHLISDSGKVISLYISYKIDTWPRDLDIDFRLCNCLFGVVE